MSSNIKTFLLLINYSTDFYKEMAVTDTMTGVYNRSAFEEWEYETSDYEGYSIATFDLNNLKWCNDNLGHAAGDAYIQASARIIKEIFGRHGKCYRIGGDEFCPSLIFSNASDMLS